MSNKKQFKQSEWSERLQMFSSGNRGRIVTLEYMGAIIAKEKPLQDIEYDPIRKGDDLVMMT